MYRRTDFGEVKSSVKNLVCKNVNAFIKLQVIQVSVRWSETQIESDSSILVALPCHSIFVSLHLTSIAHSSVNKYLSQHFYVTTFLTCFFSFFFPPPLDSILPKILPRTHWTTCTPMHEQCTKLAIISHIVVRTADKVHHYPSNRYWHTYINSTRGTSIPSSSNR